MTTDLKSLQTPWKRLVWSGGMDDNGTDMPSSCFVITVNFGQYQEEITEGKKPCLLNN